MSTKITKAYLYALISVILLSVLPLLYLSAFNHPSSDDYSYSVNTYHCWLESGSVLKVVLAAAETSREFWHKWQGLYASAFVLSLQPAIFGEKFYVIAGILMICILFAGNLILSVYLVHGILKGSRLAAAAIGCMLSFLMIQWMPSLVEGIYWFNGAANYTLFFSLLEIMICAAVSVGCAATKGKRIRRTLLTAVLGLLIAGGNHVTAFMAVLTLLTAGFSGIIFRKRKRLCWNFIPFAVTTGGFLCNMLSPGTKIRQSEFTERPDVVVTIKTVLVNGLKYIESWITIAVIVGVLLLLPVIWEIIRNFREKSGFKFSCPLLVVIFSAGWICAMFCPPVYAMGSFGAGRLVNVVYFSFVALVFVNAFYLCGWLQENVFLADGLRAGRTVITGKWLCAAGCLGVALVLASGIDSGCYTALSCVRDGSAKEYSREADQRYKVLMESRDKDVSVPAFSVSPALPNPNLDDISDDPYYYRNRTMADYFQLSSVVAVSF